MRKGVIYPILWYQIYYTDDLAYARIPIHIRIC